MINMLASVNWEDLILVGSALGVFQGGKMLLTKKPSNGTAKGDPFNQEICTLRHNQLDERHTEIKASLAELKSDMRKGFETIFNRLDNMNHRRSDE